MKSRRNMLLLFCCLALAFGFAIQPTGASAQGKTTILLDGYPLVFPIEPQIIKGHTMVPFRVIAEALGISVQWVEQSKTIITQQNSAQAGSQVILQIKNPTAMVNGQKVKLPMSPMLIKGHTAIPLRFFSTQFGAQVSWDGASRTVSIISPQKKLYSMAFYAISSFSERQLIPNFDSVAFGWSRIDAGGNLTLQGKDFYWPQPAGEITPESIIQDAAGQGTAPYLMVFAGDGAGELTKLLEDSALRDEAISGIVQLAREKQFAGVVLDFEGLGMNGDTAQVKQRYNQFVQLLAQQLRPNGIKLSLVLHPLNGAYRGYDYATLGSIADDLIVMAYAYENEKQPEPLGKVNEAIKLATAQVPKEKLILGISMGSENAQSVNSKIGLAKRYGLKGIALWRLGLIGQPAFAEMQKSVQFKQAIPVSQ
jgi:hypothetical protein